MKMLKYLLLSCLFLTACNNQINLKTSESELPKVWMTYKGQKPEKEIPDLKENGVGAITVRKPSAEILELVRKHNMKIILSIGEVVESAYEMDSNKVERAIMIGGAYQGKAIDRNRFSFTPEKHTILVENPIYDKENCYNTLGRYFPGMRDPLKAEVIIKKADFDGQQHLAIIPAEVGPKVDSVNWQISFDLTDVEGDLEHVSLAVYWISEGTRDYWMFGDAASPASEVTKEALRKNVREMVEEWAEINNGQFPEEDVIALRIGDECFQLSGHGNCPGCSYPLWDYSESSIQEYEKLTDYTYPRGKTWTDMYGREAYAYWLYNYHKNNARLMQVVRDELNSLGLENVLTFRNITRYNVFNPLNDYDGSGLDMLAKSLDIVHIDPYPINAAGYRENVIPVDMAYVAGLARRYDKLLIPWMQAHQYWPERGGLAHPGPGDVEKMVEQQMMFNPDAIMWLGYGEPPFSTFPYENPESWQKAGELHHEFISEKSEPINAEIAILRPYNVRALNGLDEMFLMDAYFTDEIISRLSIDHKPFNPFEPLNLESLDEDELKDYRFIIAEAGKLSSDELSLLAGSDKEVLVFIFEAYKEDINPEITGITRFNGTRTGNFTASYDGQEMKVKHYDSYTLDPEAEVLAAVAGEPLIWKHGKITFVSGLIEDPDQFIESYLKSVSQ